MNKSGGNITTENSQQGVTLIELIISMVVLSIMIIAMFEAMAAISKNSADPMLKAQSLSIAQSYMEEIQSKSFLDPTTALWCGVSLPTDPSRVSREQFDDICDYQVLVDNVVRDLNNNPLAGLANFEVSVSILNDASVDLEGLLGSANDSALITVTVSSPDNQNVILSTYRANNE
ncbi:MAG: type II secretion system protein [Saccharospirillaceae bacterium]|nr:type II secretion system GspH family protein [Pseudomonadales bacterium]NRB77906.1 type II secretion system protein [Saccharospirillaceae bacterium]